MLNNCDMSRQCRQLCAQGNALIRTCYMCSNDVKKTLFTYVVGFVIAMQLENCIYLTTMVLGFDRHCRASEMFVYNTMPNCAAVIRNLTYRLICQLHSSQNALICSIIKSDVKYISRIWKYWFKCLRVHYADGGSSHAVNSKLWNHNVFVCCMESKN